MKLADFLSPYNSYELSANISYGTENRHQLDIYEPIGTQVKEEVIVFIYGGSWNSGSRSDYRFIAQPFAAKGYTTIVPDYRIYPEAKFPVFIEDIAKAIVWVNRKYSSSNKESKIILIGHSAGAHIAALLALDNSYLIEAGASTKILRGWIALAGPHAFDPLKTQSTRPIFEIFKNKIDQVKPISFARAGAPPALLLHGNKDTVVYEKNSIMLADAIKNKQGAVTFTSLEDVGHIGILLSLTDTKLFSTDTKQAIFKFIKTLN